MASFQAMRRPLCQIFSVGFNMPNYSARRRFGVVCAALLCALPTLIYLVGGRDFHHAFYLNLLFMPFLLVGVYAIARRYYSARTALLAVFVTGSMPQMYGLATWFMVSMGGMK